MIGKKSIGSVIFFENHLLLLKYKNHKGDGYYWDFPKGHLKKSERKEVALHREIKNLTDLKIDVILGFEEEAIYFFRDEDELIKERVIFMVSLAESKDVKLSKEHHGFKWVTKQEARMLVKHPAAIKVLERTMSFYFAQKELIGF